MRIIQRITTCLDAIPEEKELSLRQRLTLFLWGVVVVSFPFAWIPKCGLKRVALFSITLILILNFYKLFHVCWRIKYLRYIAFFILAFSLWQWAVLPFCSNLDVISYKRNMKPVQDELLRLYGAWYVLLCTCFLLPKEKVKKIFHVGLTILLLGCATYSAIELLHFLNVQWATNFLSKSIHYLMEVKSSHGWWPPVFWPDARLRSIFPEPSFFVVIISFTTFYYGFCFLYENSWKKGFCHLLLAFLSLFLICGTRSASGTLALFEGAILTTFLFLFLFFKFNKWIKLKGLFLVFFFVAGGICSLNCQRGGSTNIISLMAPTKSTTNILHSQVNTTKNKKVEVKQIKAVPQTTTPYKTQPLKEAPRQAGIIQEKTSSITRWIHLKTELFLIAERPVTGYGKGTYKNVVREGLRKSPKKTTEILKWTRDDASWAPSLNIYTKIAIESGIVGLVLYLCMVFVIPISYSITHLRFYSKEKWMGAIVFLSVLATLGCTVVVNSLLLMVFPIYCLLLPLKDEGSNK